MHAKLCPWIFFGNRETLIFYYCLSIIVISNEVLLATRAFQVKGKLHDFRSIVLFLFFVFDAGSAANTTKVTTLSLFMKRSFSYQLHPCNSSKIKS